jgi:putative redox protein
MTTSDAAPVGDERPVVMVTVTSDAGYRGDIRAGSHRFVVDEATGVGGNDEGPNPYQLVLAGLVQCTAATLRMYADRKGWELGKITVRARLMRSGDGASRIDRIERTIGFAAAVSDEQRHRLGVIADRTPVTRTLREGVPIDTTISST